MQIPKAPHALSILLACSMHASAQTWILPAGTTTVTHSVDAQFGSNTGVQIGTASTLTVTNAGATWNKRITNSGGGWNISSANNSWTKVTGDISGFTGTLYLQSGVGIYGDAAANYAGTGATIHVASGAVLNYGGGAAAITSRTGTVHLSGTGPSWDTQTLCAIRILGASTVNQNLQLTGNAAIGVHGANTGGGVFAGPINLDGHILSLRAGSFTGTGRDFTVSGDLGGAAGSGLIKLDFGTVTLSGTGSYAGPTSIQGGTLRLVGTTTLPANLKIMPCGDSITYGYPSNAGGYRGPLYTLLSPGAPGLSFVGEAATNPGALPTQAQFHCGHSSYATYDITNNLDGFDTRVFTIYPTADRDPHGGYWLTGIAGTRAAIHPDIVLLLVGTNDIYWGNPAKQNLVNLITKINTLRPNAKIIIGRITPYTGAAAWNGYVDDAVAELSAAGKPVTKADLNTGFPANGMSGDGVHPNDTGYAWMAAKWQAAINALYGTSTARGIPAASPVAIASGATLDLNSAHAAIGSLTGAGSITLGTGGGLTVNQDSPGTFSGAISGTGSITKAGSATLFLTCSTLPIGATTVQTGTLSLAQPLLADSAPVTLAAGAVLNLAFSGTDTVAALSIGGHALPPGIYGVSTHPGILTGSGTLKVGNPTAYQIWAGSRIASQDPAADFTPTGDPDGDGIKNLVEYVIGGDPRFSSTEFLPKQAIVGTDLVLTYKRSDASESDTTQIGQWSVNLTDWFPITPEMVLENGTAPDDMKIVIPMANAVDGKLFGRLQVTKP